MRPHRRHHRLQLVPALARDADLLVLDLRRHLELPVADEAGDLLGETGFDALFDFDQLARVAQRRNIRLAPLNVLEADVALGQLGHDNLHQRLDLELVLGGELDLVFLESNLRLASLEVETIGQFFFGSIHRVLDFHRVDLTDDIK